MRSFDVLYKLAPEYGFTVGDELYRTDVKYYRFASIATDAGGAVLNLKIVTDGISVHERRDAGTPCDYEEGGRQAVRERLAEVLGWFGYDVPVLCDDESWRGASAVAEPQPPPRPFGLLAPSPNPLHAGSGGRIRFTLPRNDRAEIGIYDLQGLQVRRVPDETLPAGANQATWDGRDEAETPVGSGVYFVRLRTAGEEQSTRVVVLGAR